MANCIVCEKIAVGDTVRVCSGCRDMARASVDTVAAKLKLNLEATAKQEYGNPVPPVLVAEINRVVDGFRQQFHS